MMMVELSLILVYLCVLVIKVCDMSSFRTADLMAEKRAFKVTAGALCSSYGLGDKANGAPKSRSIRLAGSMSDRTLLIACRNLCFLGPHLVVAAASGRCHGGRHRVVRVLSTQETTSTALHPRRQFG